MSSPTLPTNPNSGVELWSCFRQPYLLFRYRKSIFRIFLYVEEHCDWLSPEQNICWRAQIIFLSTGSRKPIVYRHDAALCILTHETTYIQDSSMKRFNVPRDWICTHHYHLTLARNVWMLSLLQGDSNSANISSVSYTPISAQSCVMSLKFVTMPPSCNPILLHFAYPEHVVWKT